MKYNILDRLFKRAVNGNDSFRQWFYPKLPRSYKINQRIISIIDQDRLNNVPKEVTFNKLIEESKK